MTLEKWLEIKKTITENVQNTYEQFKKEIEEAGELTDKILHKINLYNPPLGNNNYITYLLKGHFGHHRYLVTTTRLYSDSFSEYETPDEIITLAKEFKNEVKEYIEKYKPYISKPNYSIIIDADSDGWIDQNCMAAAFNVFHNNEDIIKQHTKKCFLEYMTRLLDNCGDEKPLRSYKYVDCAHLQMFEEGAITYEILERLHNASKEC